MTRVHLFLLLLLPIFLEAQTSPDTTSSDRSVLTFVSTGSWSWEPDTFITYLMTSQWLCRDSTTTVLQKDYTPGVFHRHTDGSWSTTGGSLGTLTSRTVTWCRQFIDKVVMEPASDGSSTWRAVTVRLWLGPWVETTDD